MRQSGTMNFRKVREVQRKALGGEEEEEFENETVKNLRKLASNFK
jgi:hypothetical protein